MTFSHLKSTFGAIALSMALVAPALASGLSAHLNTDTIAMGDTFQLTLSSADASEAPDLAPLQKDFDILGTSQSTSSTIVNGRASRSQSWILTLSPRSKGTLAIPSITAGSSSSEPTEIRVVDASALPRTTGVGGVTVSSRVEAGEHFVFQEIPLTVRIETSVPLKQAQLTAPASGDFELETNGEDKVSEIRRDGKSMTVIERDFLLRPQKDGPIEIPPFVLRGSVNDPTARRNDPFADFGFGRLSGFRSSLFDRLTNPGKPFTARSEPIRLQVTARPGGAESASDWFLPAKVVRLEAQWEPADPVFREGEAVTRRISLLALGARPEQLPELTFAAPDGARIYIDDTQTRTAKTDQGTVAQRDTLISVVPTRGGAITLPEIRVDWTDSASGEQQVAILPSEVIQADGTTPVPVATSAQSLPAQSGQITEPVEAGTNGTTWAIGIGAGVLALIALVSVIAVRRFRPARADAAGTLREPATSTRTSAAEALRRAERLAKSGDLRGCYGAVLAWRRHGGGSVPPEAEDAIQALGRIAYGELHDGSSTEALRLIAIVRKKSRTGGDPATGPLRLPDLYPA